MSLRFLRYSRIKPKETIDEARRLWKAVNRENVMIKIPGTPEGLPAIRQAIGEGVNVNVTLLFAEEVYEKVAEAHIAGLEDLAKRGGNLNNIGGVASFFISRIDSMVDSMISDKLKTTTDSQQQALLNSLLGKVAIATGNWPIFATSAFSAVRGGRLWRLRARRRSVCSGQAPAPESGVS